MRKYNNLRGVFISFLLWTIFVQKATAQDMKIGEVRAGVGVNCIRPDASNSASKNSYDRAKIDCGFSAIAEAGAFETVAIELGMFYNQYQFIRSVPGGVADESVDRLHVPLLFKFWFFDSWYTAVGAYGSYRVGSVSTPSAMAPSDQRTSAYDTGEHGLEASVGAEWGFKSNQVFLRTEFRHSFSLTPRPNESRSFNCLFLALLWPVDVSL